MKQILNLNAVVAIAAIATLAITGIIGLTFGSMRTVEWPVIALCGCSIVAIVGVAASFAAYYVAIRKHPIREREVASGILYHLGLAYFCLGMGPSFVLRGLIWYGTYTFADIVTMCVGLAGAVVFSWLAVRESRLIKGRSRTAEGIVTAFPLIGPVFGFAREHTFSS